MCHNSSIVACLLVLETSVVVGFVYLILGLVLVNDVGVEWYWVPVWVVVVMVE